MIANIENLKYGSLLFIRSNTFISWLIRQGLRFKYSHVAIYIGNGKIVESDWGGVVSTDISKYLSNEAVTGEVINIKPKLIDTATFISSVENEIGEPYDFTLFIGNVLSRIFKRPRNEKGLFDHSKFWICSELAAYGLEKGGLQLDLPVSQITPKDLYSAIKRRNSNG